MVESQQVSPRDMFRGSCKRDEAVSSQVHNGTVRVICATHRNMPPSNFQKTEISIAIYLMLLVRKE
jgi:hypothetical protein